MYILFKFVDGNYTCVIGQRGDYQFFRVPDAPEYVGLHYVGNYRGNAHFDVPQFRINSETDLVDYLQSYDLKFKRNDDVFCQLILPEDEFGQFIFLQQLNA